MTSFDLYGVNPVLTIKGEGQYRSVPGSIISLVVYAVFILFTFQKGTELINRTDPTIRTRVNLIDMADPNNSFYPSDLGFEFAFSMRQALDPSFAYYEVA